MNKLLVVAILALASVIVLQNSFAQRPGGAGNGFQMQHHSHSPWTKGRFSEAVTVTAQPAGTFVNVTALAWPHMIFEVEVTAAVAK